MHTVQELTVMLNEIHFNIEKIDNQLSGIVREMCSFSEESAVEKAPRIKQQIDNIWPILASHSAELKNIRDEFRENLFFAPREQYEIELLYRKNSQILEDTYEKTNTVSHYLPYFFFPREPNFSKTKSTLENKVFPKTMPVTLSSLAHHFFFPKELPYDSDSENPMYAYKFCIACIAFSNDFREHARRYARPELNTSAGYGTMFKRSKSALSLSLKQSSPERDFIVPSTGVLMVRGIR